MVRDVGWGLEVGGVLRFVGARSNWDSQMHPSGVSCLSFTWIPKVCRIMVCLAMFGGFERLFYLLLVSSHNLLWIFWVWPQDLWDFASWRIKVRGLELAL